MNIEGRLDEIDKKIDLILGFLGAIDGTKIYPHPNSSVTGNDTYYVLGRSYEFRYSAGNINKFLFAEFKKAIDSSSEIGENEEELRALSRKHNNNGFFKYCVRHGWIMPVEEAR